MCRRQRSSRRSNSPCASTITRRSAAMSTRAAARRCARRARQAPERDLRQRRRGAPHWRKAQGMSAPQRRRFSDGRLHLHDGPIDLIIEAFGEDARGRRGLRRGVAPLHDHSRRALCGIAFAARADPLDSRSPKASSRAGWLTRCCAVRATALHHPDGGGRRRRRRGSPERDDCRGAAVAAPMSTTAATSRFICRLTRHSPSAWSIGPTVPALFGRATIMLRTRGARPSDVGLARPQLLAWHRRRCHGPRGLAPRSPMRRRPWSPTPSIFRVTQQSGVCRRVTCDPQSDLGERRVTVDVGPLASREIDERSPPASMKPSFARRGPSRGRRAAACTARPLVGGANRSRRRPGHCSPAQSAQPSVTSAAKRES